MTLDKELLKGSVYPHPATWNVWPAVYADILAIRTGETELARSKDINETSFLAGFP